MEQNTGPAEKKNVCVRTFIYYCFYAKLNEVAIELFLLLLHVRTHIHRRARDSEYERWTAANITLICVFIWGEKRTDENRIAIKNAWDRDRETVRKRSTKRPTEYVMRMCECECVYGSRIRLVEHLKW